MSIILHQANGLEIGQRREDGYINATAMCVAYKKDISDWLKTDNAWELVVALAKKIQVQPVEIKSHKSGNSVFTRVSATYPTLIVVKRGAPSNGGGTWIHYKLAVPLAMWISAEFALLVSDWVEHWLTTYQNPINESIQESFSAAAKAYIESSQALNRTIHTAIHQQTDSLREALKFLESKDNSTVNEELAPPQIEQAPDINTVRLDLIKLPHNQPRRYFDEQKLLELSESIREFGILQPLLVRQASDGEYKLIAGKRRLRAAKEAKLTKVPIVSKELSVKASLPISNVVLPALELRYFIDEKEVAKIVATGRKNGIIEPLLVRPILDSDKYEVVAGAKRYRASQILELEEVPVVIRELNDEEALEIALIENFARSSLTDLEEADGVLRLLGMKLEIPVSEIPTQLHHIQNQLRDRLATTNNVINDEKIQLVQEVLMSLGNIKLDSFISNRLPLLNLPNDILSVLRAGQLEASKAKVIAKIEDVDVRKKLLSEAIAEELSLTQIKLRISALTQSEESIEEKPLQERVDDTFKRLKKAKVWDDPKKQARIEKLLAQLNALIK